MMRIGVVAHTSRVTYAKRLANVIRADFVSIDNGTLGADGNHEAVQYHLSALPSTFSVILEDDAIPVEGFRDQLEHALPLCPSPIASLYLGKQRPPQYQHAIRTAIEAAELEAADWIVGTRLFHAVGYAIKTELIPSLLDHITHWPVDEHISSWARLHGHTVAYAYPSLVDHLDGPTLVAHPDGKPRTPGRVAWKTQPHETWTSKSVTVRTAP